MLKKFLAFAVMLYAAVAMAAVDVNKASEADLDNVKGIGPITSKLIMTERKKGPFKDWEDFISRVKGIGESRAAKLSEDGLTVNGSAFKAASAATKDDKKADKKAEQKQTSKDTKAAAAESKSTASKSAAAQAKPATVAPAVAAAPGKPDAGAANAASPAKK